MKITGGAGSFAIFLFRLKDKLNIRLILSLSLFRAGGSEAAGKESGKASRTAANAGQEVSDSFFFFFFGTFLLVIPLSMVRVRVMVMPTHSLRVYLVSWSTDKEIQNNDKEKSVELGKFKAFLSNLRPKVIFS